MLANSMQEIFAYLKTAGRMLNEALYDKPNERATFSIRLDDRVMRHSLDSHELDTALKGFMVFLGERGIMATYDISRSVDTFDWTIHIQAERYMSPARGASPVGMFNPPMLKNVQGWDEGLQFYRHQERQELLNKERRLLEKAKQCLPHVEVKSFDDGITKLEKLTHDTAGNSGVPKQDGSNTNPSNGERDNGVLPGTP